MYKANANTISSEYNYMCMYMCMYMYMLWANARFYKGREHIFLYIIIKCINILLTQI